MKRLLLFINICMVGLALGLPLQAQQTGAIVIPDVYAQAGSEVLLPVNVTNSVGVVAVQFDLTLPADVVLDESSAQLTDRADDHIVQVKANNGAYRLMVFSPENRKLHGGSGQLLTVRLRLGDSLLSEQEYPMSVSRAMLSDSQGNNVLTQTQCGSIKIMPSPDFVPTAITAQPAQIAPEGEVLFQWTVQNQGKVAATGGFTEQLLLTTDDGRQLLLGTTVCNDILEPNQTVSRQATLVLPRLPGMHGQVRPAVRLVSDDKSGERPEHRGNNLLKADDELQLARCLYLEMPSRTTEGNRTLQCRLQRSGNCTDAETFNLTLKGDNRLTAPESIVFQRGASATTFTLTLTNNDLLDADSLFTVTISGNDYPSLSNTLTVVDDEKPKLTLTALKSVVDEGSTFTMTLTRQTVTDYPLEVTLNCDQPARFNFPQKVEIAAKEAMATFEVAALDDADQTDTLSVAFTATAEGHATSQCVILLADNDLPRLQLELTPTEVSEGAGLMAIVGKLRKLDHLDSRITVSLTDNSNGRIYYPLQKIVMESGQEEVELNLGVVDNSTVDGNLDIRVTASVVLTNCNCSASQTSGASVSQTIRLLDDDGPTLTIASQNTSLLEGSEGNILTISRNTDTGSPLTVTLSSDADDMLTYSPTATIAAGQRQVQVKVAVKKNNTEGDSRNVAFRVEADGFAPGTCWARITDRTMPDAVIKALRTDVTETLAGQTISAAIVVENRGSGILPNDVQVILGCSGSNTRMALLTPEPLAPGDSVVLLTDYTMPLSVGNFNLQATINDNRSVTELSYSNNTSPAARVTLLPNFTATISTDRQLYTPGQTVVMEGQTTEGGANATVEVYVMNNGVQQKQMLTADANGHFSTTYTPLDRQMGHFTVGACFPGAAHNADSEVAFDVYGLRLGANYATHEIDLGDETQGTIVIENPGLLPQTGLVVELLDDAQQPSPITLHQGKDGETIPTPATIAAGERIEVAYTLKGTAVTEGSDWRKVPVRISTAEGSTAEFGIYYYVHQLKPRLVVSQQEITTTMVIDKPREYMLRISNTGRGATGKITLALPEWVETVTPREMGSLEQGDTATVVMRFVPTDRMQLNVTVRGQMGINCEQGDGVAVRLNVTPVSEQKGTLTIDVVDEYTYYAEGGPHVEGARVLVKNPSTGAVTAQGLTGADGRYSVELPEGWYNISVNADKHQGYQTQLVVDPGRETGREIFLTYEAISYDWKVEETEVEDYYEIETVAKFETNVPKPVVTVSLPEEMPQVGGVVPVVIENHGLIRANDVDITLNVTEGLQLEWLETPSLQALAPGQKVTLYAVLKEAGSSADSRSAFGAPSASEIVKGVICFVIYVKLLGHYVCGEYDNVIAVEKSRAWGKCTSSSFSGGSLSGGGGGGGSGGGGGWSGGGGTGGSSGPSSGPSTHSNQNQSSSSNYNNIALPKKICHERDLEKKLNVLEEGGPSFAQTCYKVDLHYELIPVEGTRYIVSGVAADSLSQVKIALTRQSVVPMESCNYTIEWRLLEDIGKLSNTDGWEGVIYTAPADYPKHDLGKSYTVKAEIHYTDKKLVDGRDTVCINLVRAPVALIHGLNSDPGCWNDYAKHLCKSGLYDSYQVLCADYSATHCDHFTVNIDVPQKAIDALREQCLQKGIIATQADLIGHSMGGILSRLHVQKDDSYPNVHKLITVNTPHSGSPFGNLVMEFPVVKSLFDDKGIAFDKTDAIADLAVNSSAIDELLNDSYKADSEVLARMKNIPIHSITSIVTDATVLTGYQALSMYTASLSDFDPNSSLEINYRKFIANLGYGEEFAIAMSNGDMIVPYDSQHGGLEVPYSTNYHGGLEVMHTNITKHEDVQKQLDILLKASVNDYRFSRDGFMPVDLDYNIQKSRNEMAGRTNHIPTKVTKAPLGIVLAIDGDSLRVNILNYDDYAVTHQAVAVKFSDFTEVMGQRQFALPIPSTQLGDITVYAYLRTAKDELLRDSASIYVAARTTTPVAIECKQLFDIVIGTPRSVTLVCTWADGSKTRVKADEATFTDNLARYADGVITPQKAGSGTATFTYQGLTCEAPFTVYDFGNGDDDEDSHSVCSTITLKLSQQMVLTRQAFRGTLTVNNGLPEQMRDVKLYLEVRDEDGTLATNHEFQVNTESLTGFDGQLDLTAGWTLNSRDTGVATVLFIPTRYAAPETEKRYSFGGTFAYTDSNTGLTVSRDLYPVWLTVKPTPVLDLTYFLQRDIVGDDPLTEQVVEPSEPAEFALIINNVGSGVASNVRFTTQQPEIIDNQKGLAIEWELLSSQMNGQPATLALGQAVQNDFGNIAAGQQAYAQWWLQSSLLGHFISYDVTATHLSSYGNADLSLLGNVTIHELIHGFTPLCSQFSPPSSLPQGGVGGGSSPRAFLVNDVPDNGDQPDQVYFTDGTQQDVYTAAEAYATPTTATEYTLTVRSQQAGWNYGWLADPTGGTRQLQKVVRVSDGAEIATDNFWQTDRVLRDGKDWLYENRLHYVTLMENGEESFTLTFGPVTASQTMVLAEGWNWVSSYLSEPLPVQKLAAGAQRILGQTDELIDDPVMGMVGTISALLPWQAYKVQAKKDYLVGFGGETIDISNARLNLLTGWNWVACPFAEQQALAAAIANAEEGDYLTAQQGFANYADGQWEGTLEVLTPGNGYLYKSASDKALQFNTPTAESRISSQKPLPSTDSGIDIHRYPNTMNVTAQISSNNMTLDDDGYTICAFAGDELRGQSRYVNGRHYLTVYGDQPVRIDFLVRQNATGQFFKAGETLTFHSDVVGSRNSPFTITIAGSQGIDTPAEATPSKAVYTLEGILVDNDITQERLKRLPKGVYIINGKKRFVK